MLIVRERTAVEGQRAVLPEETRPARVDREPARDGENAVVCVRPRWIDDDGTTELRVFRDTSEDGESVRPRRVVVGTGVVRNELEIARRSGGDLCAVADAVLRAEAVHPHRLSERVMNARANRRAHGHANERSRRL